MTWGISLCQFTLRAEERQPNVAANARILSSKLDRFEFSELQMGVRARLVVWAPSRERAESACRLAFARMAELENSMSDYRPHSEINRLAARAGGPAVPISADLFFVLAHAQHIARLSDGAFDVTIAPLIQLWRRARKSKTLPPPAELAHARALVGWKYLRLDRKKQTAQLIKHGMKLDLGGIAKGYAGDCVLDVLRRQGIKRALFEAGGDIVLGDAPPGQRGWNIEVENAAPSAPKMLSLSNCAVSTSGDTNQFVVIGGKRYSHVVNPKTGLGLTNRVIVTVIAPRGMTADALSKLGVADEKHRRRLLRAFPDVKAYIRRVKS